MPKKDIHPEWYENSEVYCDGQLVYTVSSTKEKLNVDIWSGNHPYYTGSKKLLDTEGRVDFYEKIQFRKKLIQKVFSCLQYNNSLEINAKR
jgi:large subunit ribosomal protein L31